MKPTDENALVMGQANSKSTHRASITLVGLLIFNSVFVASHVVYALGFRALVYIPLSVVVLLSVMFFQNRRLSIWGIFIVLVAFITASVSGIYWGSWKVFFYTANIGTSLLLALVASKRELEKTVSIGSTILLPILIGAWIAFFLQVSGVSPAAIFVAAGGREIPFYYTSLATLIWSPFGDMIRLNGIYDEPGTLSFMVCLFAFFRHIMGMGKRLTWIILLLGFITFSLAHLVYVFIHLLSERHIRKMTVKVLFIGILIFGAMSATGFFEYFEYFLISRLEVSPDNRIVSGDNRSGNLYNDLLNINNAGSKELMFGFDISFIEGSGQTRQGIEEGGSNPLTPLVQYGFLIAWPYYLFLLFATGLGLVRRQFWPLFGVGLLFMQRPSVMSSGYAMLAALTVIIMLRLTTFKQAFAFIQRNISHGRIEINKR